MPRLSSMIMPKCTGSTPKFFITGSRVGVAINIEGAMSTSVPSTSKRMLIRNRMTYLLSDIDRKNAVIFAGICVSAMMQPTGDQRQQRGDRAQPRVEVTVRID